MIRRIAYTALLCCALVLAACQVPVPKELTMPDSPASASIPANSVFGTLIPKPVAVTAAGGTFTITAATQIAVAPTTDAVRAIGDQLAERLRPATGYPLPVLDANPTPSTGQITLTTVGGDPRLGAEGYELTITPDGVTISAAESAGLFY